MFYIQLQLQQKLDQWNEYVCMYVNDDSSPLRYKAVSADKKLRTF